VEPLNLLEYERLAADLLEPGAYGYFSGGAGDELTMADNLAAYRRWQFRPRVLVDVSHVSTATTVLGRQIALPVLVAPVAWQRAAHPDGEGATARATAAAGTIMCLSTFANATLAEIAASGAARWFQLYVPRDPGLAAETIGAAVAHGFEALVLTVDTPVIGRRERDFRTGFVVQHPPGLDWVRVAQLTPHGVGELVSPAVTWDDVERFAELSSLPVVLKGIMTPEDARLACEHGAAGIVVSNHGGRQLDGVPATLDVLEEVVEAVDGRLEVLLDGGIRRGADAVKALALGARAVLIGRPAVWGLTVAGEQGVRHVLELLRAEIALALQLLGCPDVAAVTRAHVART
jgi:isopentenyl diphosphate isomerase/L-lactate dehydrogenase-like FMN-dependent dehydrogenase